MTKVVSTILTIVVTATVCAVAYPAIDTALARRAAARIADRKLPHDAQLVGKSYYFVPPAGNGYSVWVFSIPAEAWKHEFGICPNVKKLTGSDLDSYHLHTLFKTDQPVCFGIPEETNDVVRAWFAADSRLVVFTELG